jgi:hypothetical protein
MAVEDLDIDAVERYLAYRAEPSRSRRRLGEAIELLPALKAVAQDPATGQIRPTNAGILMFGLDPQLPLPQSEVVCIKYADPLGVRRYIDRKNFRGTLPELIDQASRFLAQYIRVGATIEECLVAAELLLKLGTGGGGSLGTHPLGDVACDADHGCDAPVGSRLWHQLGVIVLELGGGGKGEQDPRRLARGEDVGQSGIPLVDQLLGHAEVAVGLAEEALSG